VKVSEKQVTVSEKQAHTAEIAMIIDGFTESLAAVQSQLDRAEKAYLTLDAKHEELKQKHEGLVKDHETLASRIDLSERDRAQMIAHIVALEALIPNPPGPPERPKWN
jgi:predicted  nucleic acid-binding Zn-ribbon protein